MTENKDEKEIDLLELARKLWDNKKFILKATLVGTVIGLIIAFSIPKEYTSTVVFTTNANDLKTGNMGALATLAGINLNVQPSENFSPELYPNIINSTSFVKGLLGIDVEDKNQKIDTTLYVYLKDEQKRTWWNYLLRAPSLLFSLFKSEQTKKGESLTNQFSISDEEMKVITALTSSYNINTDKKTGVTVFEISSQSPTISAFLADTITSYLQTYIIEERTKKSQADLDNSYKLYRRYKEDYDKAQQKLASFIDRNRNIISESYRTNQRKLELEANLAYDVYNQMAKQVQMNEIKVQDEIPVFTIIQPAVEPIYPTVPKKIRIMLICSCLSLICSVVFAVRRDILSLLISA